MRPVTLLLTWLILSFSSIAQTASDNCAETKRRSFAAAKTTVASLLEDDYDVKHVKLDLQLTDLSNYIIGNVTTQAQVVKGPMSQYVFELYRTFKIDSVKVNDQVQNFDTANSLCTVTLRNSLLQGSLFTAQVYYHGYPPVTFPLGSGAGYVNVHNSLFDISYSLSEPYSSYYWWPCKQSLKDKIDSTDTWITIPSYAKVGSNGLLTEVEYLGSNLVRHKWKERYPIDYYLISVALGRYSEYTYNLQFDNSTDSMPIVNYYFNVTNDAPPFDILKKRLDSTAIMINYFSGLFGRYPFWKEKYGHCYSPAFSNMEHQTMSTVRYTNTGIIVHELAHQWFGDNVTCATWSDIWLNEGIATYAEYLFYSKYYGAQYASNYLRIQHKNILSKDSGTVYVLDTNEYRTFDGRLTYQKGSSVLHMLRFAFNNDSLFFSFLTGYQKKFAGSNATTEDFKHLAENYLGQNLDVFFDQWIYKEGYPIYYSSWNQDNNVLFIKVSQQTPIPTSVFNFVMPIAVKLYSQQGDTVVRLHNDLPSQVFTIVMDRPIDSIALDPGEDLLCKQGNKPYHEPTLNTLSSNITLYPNPVNSILNIAYRDLQEPTLLLFDATGRKLLEHRFRYTSGIEQIDVQLLPNAVYLYKVIDKGAVKSEGKFLKQ